MNHFDKDEIPILSETHGQRSDEPQDSTFRRNISRTRSASISIPMASLDPYERQPNLVRHTGPLCTTKKTPVSQMSGPLNATPLTGNPFQNKTEKIFTFYGPGRYEHLLRSGQLGMCHDPYCTTCPTYFKVSQQRKPRASNIFDHKFHNSLHGDTKGFGRKLFSFCSSCIPGVMNPHTKVVLQWNKVLAIFCMVTIFVDPLFFFSLYVNKDNKCIQINLTMARTLVILRSITDVVYLLNILLQFRLAYVSSPQSYNFDAGELVDHPRKIAVKYLKTYFFFDVFVGSPLPQCFKSISQIGNNSFCCTFGSQQILLSCVTDELKWKLHESRQKSSKTFVRFEMPYNIWCGGCNSTTAKGVRFNAEKKQVGNYYSTKQNNASDFPSELDIFYGKHMLFKVEVAEGNLIHN
ncbi:probable cyclic nucleotide-gated ion channel 20, chloroplastic isoform X2 [Medicago truncatula]|uniref:probable cyclic nucleotide-gated ion channel 20, chloroplastic isoform X2 n=1 Tax=Medicago truncatula TaxID=3880 RepID=UPI0019685A68|nr:probable cyclic nucleotide-gated ion channel 20, chloroplastic isoform X2 [Medicago truncatula]